MEPPGNTTTGSSCSGSFDDSDGPLVGFLLFFCSIFSNFFSLAVCEAFSQVRPKYSSPRSANLPTLATSFHTSDRSMPFSMA